MLQKPIYGFTNPLIKATNKLVSQLVGARQEEGAQRRDVTKSANTARKSHSLLTVILQT